MNGEREKRQPARDQATLRPPNYKPWLKIIGIRPSERGIRIATRKFLRNKVFQGGLTEPPSRGVLRIAAVPANFALDYYPAGEMIE